MGYICFTTHVEAPLEDVFALHADAARIPEAKFGAPTVGESLKNRQ